MERVLVISPSGRKRGGAEEILEQFLRSASGSGWEVRTLFLEDGDHFDSLRNRFPCSLIPAGRLRNVGAWLVTNLRIYFALRAWRPDAIIGWQSKAVAYAGWPARLIGCPFLCFHRGLPDWGLVDRLSFVFPCNGYLANSKFTAGEVRKRTVRPVEIVHSAVDLSRFEEARKLNPRELKKQRGFDPERPLIGVVARLQRWKGVHVFVDAIAEAKKQIPALQAVVVGGPHDQEPAYEGELAAQIVRLDLRETIRLVGKKSDVPLWMQAMDVVVHASDREPFGIVVVEAMSLGKPVIATKPGGPEEIITDGREGFLVPFGNEAILAETIVKCLRDPVKISQVSVAARTRAQSFLGVHYADKVRMAASKILGFKNLSTER